MAPKTSQKSKLAVKPTGKKPAAVKAKPVKTEKKSTPSKKERVPEGTEAPGPLVEGSASAPAETLGYDRGTISLYLTKLKYNANKATNLTPEQKADCKKTLEDSCLVCA